MNSNNYGFSNNKNLKNLKEYIIDKNQSIANGPLSAVEQVTLISYTAWGELHGILYD